MIVDKKEIERPSEIPAVIELILKTINKVVMW